MMSAPSSPTVSSSIAVAAPPEHVYSLISDLPRMGQWSSENRGGRWVGAQRGPRVGAWFVGTNKGTRRWWPTATLVTGADPGRRFAFETRLGPVVAAEWEYEIAPTDEGCRVTESWTDRRTTAVVVIGKYLTGVDDRVAHTREMIDTTLARLKEAAEQRA